MSDPLRLKCFACGLSIGKRDPEADLVDTRDGQMVWVGSACHRRVIAAGEAGYQPPLGGPHYSGCLPAFSGPMARSPNEGDSHE